MSANTKTALMNRSDFIKYLTALTCKENTVKYNNNSYIIRASS